MGDRETFVEWPIRWVRYSERLRVWVHTLLNRRRAAWWRVELGAGCRFWGRTLFRRAPGSSIGVGENCQFRSTVWSNPLGVAGPCILNTVRENARIRIGNRVGMSGTVVCAAESVEIGDDVFCGANVKIMDTDFHGVRFEDRCNGGVSAPVRIEEKVWLGVDVLVLKGVTIGAGTVVAARSVVTRSLPAGVIAAGQPARVLKEIPRRAD